ncbi:hypothetical protein TWF694_001452 [Orbilia ellipsospora]|uniref:Uncharacterized protein n=1 Tax=Orbilia ellipsospora TaxID=2528407 RepID=A0AAV9XU69_9PEZI
MEVSKQEAAQPTWNAQVWIRYPDKYKINSTFLVASASIETMKAEVYSKILWLASLSIIACATPLPNSPSLNLIPRKGAVLKDLDTTKQAAPEIRVRSLKAPINIHLPITPSTKPAGGAHIDVDPDDFEPDLDIDPDVESNSEIDSNHGTSLDDVVDLFPAFPESFPSLKDTERETLVPNRRIPLSFDEPDIRDLDFDEVDNSRITHLEGKEANFNSKKTCFSLSSDNLQLSDRLIEAGCLKSISHSASSE